MDADNRSLLQSDEVSESVTTPMHGACVMQHWPALLQAISIDAHYPV